MTKGDVICVKDDDTFVFQWVKRVGVTGHSQLGSMFNLQQRKDNVLHIQYLLLWVNM